MSWILNIESSAEVCSVCLAENGVVKATKTHPSPFSHAASLTVLIEAILAENDCTVAQLAAVAVNEGPGSYTGLRIGMAVAKGICYGADKPLIVVSAFESVLAGCSRKIQPAEADYLVLIDARRADGWYGFFDTQHRKIADGFMTINEDSIVQFYRQKPLFICGNAGFKVKNEWISKFGTLVEFFQYESGDMALISYRKFLEKDFAELAYAEPYYLKNFEKK